MLILYNPPSSNLRKPIVPNSLLSVAALLEGHYSYRIIDGNLEADPLKTLTEAVQDREVEVLGVTVMPGPQLSHCAPQCRALKMVRPDLKIVWGGYFPTQHYEACLRSDYVDFVVRGYGEFVFKELLEAICEGGDFSDIRGLAFKEDSSGRIIKNGMAVIPNPERLPDLPYHTLEMERYARSTFLGKRTYSYHSSYGCPFKCNFCAVVSLAEGRWLPQSARRTAEGIRHLVQHWKADAIEFHDNNFFVYERRTAEFSERIRDLGISWWGEARIDTLLNYSNQTWHKMKESGLVMVFLGAESGSDEVLQRMDKGGSARVEQTLEIAEKMAHLEIIPEFSFVVGNPPEPERDLDQTIRFIRRLKRVNPKSEIILYLYTPVELAGNLYETAMANGFQFPQTLEEWTSSEWLEFSQRRSRKLPWMVDSIRGRLRDFERVLNAFYPTATDHRLTQEQRQILRLFSSWRYHLEFYRWPFELRLIRRLIPYQRPETSGF